jgi:NNP family nitrate/nitrite transporter-like MFS transporter
MANGATYSVAPFLSRDALGSVTGIVGAGGNVGAVAAGFLFKSPAIAWPTALFLLSILVTCVSLALLAVRFGNLKAPDTLPAPDPVPADSRVFHEAAAQA